MLPVNELPTEDGGRHVFANHLSYRLIGLYCILVVPSMVLHRQATLDWMTPVFRTIPRRCRVLSAITLTIGLAMVLAHLSG